MAQFEQPAAAANSAGVLRPIQRIFWVERAILARAKRDQLDLSRLAPRG